MSKLRKLFSCVCLSVEDKIIKLVNDILGEFLKHVEDLFENEIEGYKEIKLWKFSQKRIQFVPVLIRQKYGVRNKKNFSYIDLFSLLILMLLGKKLTYFIIDMNSDARKYVVKMISMNMFACLLGEDNVYVYESPIMSKKVSDTNTFLYKHKVMNGDIEDNIVWSIIEMFAKRKNKLEDMICICSIYIL